MSVLDAVVVSSIASVHATTPPADGSPVPTYSYRCVDCGPFDLVRPMAAAGEQALCPGCGGAGRRTFGAPALRGGDAGARAAIEAGERSAEAPQVVRSIPTAGPRRTVRTTTDPRHARLPRP